MTEWVIIFVVAVFALMVWSSEDEITDSAYNDWLERTELRSEGLDFEDGMEKIDSLWSVIKKWKR